jgi:DNA-binding PadR family transcriptional regulator
MKRDSMPGGRRRPADPDGAWAHRSRGDAHRGGPGFGFGRPGFGQMPGGRARRGDMQAAILGLLAEQPMHGYQVIQELATRSGGVWTPGPGSVYPTLQAMEEQGLVAGEQDGSRRVFTLTDAGRAAAGSHEHDRSPMPWEQIAEASGPRIDLRQSIGALFAASAQIERTGTADQVEKAVALIDQTRKALYLLLAE